ncbi:hypothetical protein HZY83_02400 [Gemella sp. GH3]|uniref:hypothetical protein n=1 Tax=unclassified Gemella TaxID=2624949 RepID=UPI0015D0C9BE|nr:MULTISPECIES: hypothetical protein [unclassified Gemella]MBF0713537.1 hypothetical protein [Gemella sp. GH3.1]NYS50489.1 hypothetical protein [Gemella sp. GH3]
MNLEKIKITICSIIIIMYPVIAIYINDKISPLDLCIIFTKSLFIYLGLSLYINNINKKDDK